jgi:hypothetical protein
MREVFRKAAGPLVERGFSVRGCEAQRRHGSTLQRIYLQADRHNHEDFGAFFVNVAITFDDLRALDRGEAVPGILDWSARLQRLVPDVPSGWELRKSTNRGEVAAQLGAALEGTLKLLDSMRSAQDAVANLPELEGFELILRARLKYVSRDFDGALADLVALHRRFPDRVDIRDIVTRENMSELEPRIATELSGLGP